MLCFYFWHLRIGVLTRLSKGAFNGCSSLSSIEIPDSVTSIGDDVYSFLYRSFYIKTVGRKKIVDRLFFALDRKIYHKNHRSKFCFKHLYFSKMVIFDTNNVSYGIDYSLRRVYNGYIEKILPHRFFSKVNALLDALSVYPFIRNRANAGKNE